MIFTFIAAGVSVTIAGAVAGAAGATEGSGAGGVAGVFDVGAPIPGCCAQTGVPPVMITRAATENPFAHNFMEPPFPLCYRGCIICLHV